MFGKGLRLFRVFGFEIKVDLSWIIIAVLVTWSLAEGVFPAIVSDLSTSAYWIMGAVGALALFFSIVFHELSHSLIARNFGMEMKGITLFVFGGVSEMADEPPSAKAEASMAIAGPASSVVLGVIFYAIYFLGSRTDWPTSVNAVLFYLGFLNLLLAGFNLLPAFPLDGGRVLRAILWGAQKNMLKATRIASWIGSAFGIALIAYGVFILISGNFIGGIWAALIGMFLRGSAQSAYQQLLIREGLRGLKVSRFMKPDVVTVPASASVEDLVENYVYKYNYKLFPVMESNRLKGCVVLQQIKDVPRSEWGMRRVGELSRDCSTDNTIEAEADAALALAKMSRTSASRLMVVQDSKLVGIIALKDLLGYLSLKNELGG